MIRTPLSSTLFPYTTLFRSERARDSLSSTQIHRFDMLDDRCLLEANIFGRTPRKHAFYRAAAWPEQFPKPSKRSEEHTSELQSQSNLVCRLLLEKKKQLKSS